MTEGDGTYSKLFEVAEGKTRRANPPPAMSRERHGRDEDITTTPYISQNYRFTEDELRWLRRQAYSLTEKLGTRVSQNTILRVALHFLRDSSTKNTKHNPLLDALSQLKK